MHPADSLMTSRRTASASAEAPRARALSGNSRHALFPFWFCWPAGAGLLVTVRAFDDDHVSSVCAAIVFALCSWVCQRTLRLDWLSPAMVYLYVFGGFHLGLVVPWSLGINSATPPGWLLKYGVTPALTLVIVALLAYQAGAYLSVSRGAASADVRTPPLLRSNTELFHLGLIVAAIGFAFFVWGVRSIGIQRFLQASYIDTFRLVREHDPRLFVTSLTVAPIGLYLAAACAPRRHFRWVAAPALLWTAVILFIGFRSFALVAFITCLAVLKKRGFHLPRYVYALGLITVLVAIPIVRSMRDSSLTNRSVSKAIATVKPLAAIEEMGGSLEPLVHTIRLMENESYRWGRTYWLALQRVVPSVSSQWKGARYIPLEDLPPTHWVTRLAASWKYNHYGGIGFSAVAEPYMNFGVAGVAAYFLVLAMALVWADRFDGSRPTRLAMWATVLGPLLLTTRGAFDAFFRPAIWGLIVVFVSRVVADSLYSMRRTSRASHGQTRLRPGLHPGGVSR